LTEALNLSIQELGWNKGFQESFENINDEFKVGRVAIEYKNMYKLFTSDGEILATVSGKLNHSAQRREDYPAVGDWVIIDRTSRSEGNAVIYGILPRKSKFSRKVAGQELEEQIIAVNIDTLFICMSLNNNFNLRRLERYLVMAWDSGATPVVLLTKADLCSEVEKMVEDVESVAYGVNCHVISALDNRGIDELNQYLGIGKTVAFLGSSGIGKSTLINLLVGKEKLATQEIREDGRGRHTTTHRELIVLPQGGVVIDTPGMREFHILDAGEGLGSAFDDIEELAAKCKFNDCKHENEPGCAVQKALLDQSLPEGRYSNYLKLKREAEYMARKADKKVMADHKKDMKKFYNSVKSIKNR